jgi:hypothetical protein
MNGHMTEFFDHYNFDLNFHFFPFFKDILLLFKNVIVKMFFFFHKEGKFIISKVL